MYESAAALWVALSQSLHGFTQQVMSASPSLAACPGYIASNVVWHSTGMVAHLKLAGEPCNIYGKDIKQLNLQVECQSQSRIHVQILDPELQIYQIPESVLPRPEGQLPCEDSDLEFIVQEAPFSFAVRRKSDQNVLFNTSGTPFVFEDQYWRLSTSLPENPNLYGLGEHSDPLRLNTTSYTRTLWNRDAGADVPEGTNLYGAHPVYFENRVERTSSGKASTHGVALVNSNGMDVKIDRDSSLGQYLEYNVIGGIVDLYFLSGPTPFDVARQYSEVVGKPAMMPYFSFGSHQCRYGYNSVADLEEVVTDYSEAGIPLETIWTDIDYLENNKVFTLDPERFPLKKMQKFVRKLHEDSQHYVVMVDPAVAYQDYPAFNRGRDLDIFLRNTSNQIYQGVVWPGLSAYPDWFSRNVQEYWHNEFARFFDAYEGVDIDSLWIDMNEPSNFCSYPCIDPSLAVKQRAQKQNIALAKRDLVKRSVGSRTDSGLKLDGNKLGLPGRNLDKPKYKIQNAWGELSSRTANVTLLHQNGLAMYDTHNLYGAMMSLASYEAMLARRPGRRTMVITRSTFMGSGSKVGHWLGDNASTWYHYRQSIRHMLQFTSIFQIPMIGADICGFARNTTEALCARWVRLGAWYPFMRNHNSREYISQEYYRWPMVAESAKKAIDLRYRLIDYLYSQLHLQSLDGTPAVVPMWMHYPSDPGAAAIDDQFFFGPAFLISPVLEENSTSVSIYLPDDLFYDLSTLQPIFGNASHTTLHNISLTEIPVHLRGGNIVAMRVSGANTTTQLRTKNFELLIAPGRDGKASGYLYLDDGESLEQAKVSEIRFMYEDHVLSMRGRFEYPVEELQIERAVILGENHGLKNMPLRWPLTNAATVAIEDI